MDASARPLTSRHLGLDLGGTNIKWVVVEHDGAALADARPRPGRDPVGGWPGRRRRTPRRRSAPRPSRAARASSTVGIGVPGLYDPAAGTTRFLVNIPGDWAGRPVAEPVATALGPARRA